ncbi:hypothetical protein CDAR_409831 [Caerostris darwini]|uniref:Uncharacterized protein n=1 Tax=Caerostris darwini TaxID=1538125 RepID=A0AAV4RMX2_9ARAC|nr:hypothetical protein CDAR_409831 [Caerostris darwini]
MGRDFGRISRGINPSSPKDCNELIWISSERNGRYEPLSLYLGVIKQDQLLIVKDLIEDSDATQVWITKVINNRVLKIIFNKLWGFAVNFENR